MDDEIAHPTPPTATTTAADRSNERTALLGSSTSRDYHTEAQRDREVLAREGELTHPRTRPYSLRIDFAIGAILLRTSSSPLPSPCCISSRRVDDGPRPSSFSLLHSIHSESTTLTTFLFLCSRQWLLLVDVARRHQVSLYPAHRTPRSPR